MVAAEELSDDDRLPCWKAWVLIAALCLAFWVVVVALALAVAR